MKKFFAAILFTLSAALLGQVSPLTTKAVDPLNLPVWPINKYGEPLIQDYNNGLLMIETTPPGTVGTYNAGAAGGGAPFPLITLTVDPAHLPVYPVGAWGQPLLIDYLNGKLITESLGGSGGGSVTVVGGGNLGAQAIVTGGGLQTIQTAALTATLDNFGNLSTPGTASFGVGSTVAGSALFGTGTLPAYAQGKLTYDTANDALTFYNSDSAVSLQIGQEFWVRVKNTSGSTIANGAAVYINGYDGTSSLVTVALANANSSATATVIGLATESIANNGIGFVTQSGVVHGLDTSGFTAGARLYLSTTNGVLTTTAPATPNYKTTIGFVGNSAAGTAGMIVVSLAGSQAPSSPGGSDTYVQFNDGGAFGGTADWTWNKTTFISTINVLGVYSVGGNTNLSNNGLGTNSGTMKIRGAAGVELPDTDLMFSQSGTGKTRINGLTDGNLLLWNQATTGFTVLQLGGTTSSFLGLYTNGSGLDIKDASGAGFTALRAGTGTFSDNISTSVIGKTLLVKSGSNAKAGTFTLTGGAATVANTSITVNSCIVGITIKTASGARTGNPYVATVTPGTGFTLAGGSATDNGTYNYMITEVN